MGRIEEAGIGEAVLAPYLPRLARTWEAEAPGERLRELEGSLVSVDLSGFTALSERLAAKGRIGAEELILVISGTFEGLIGIAERHGGDVLKFRGDALLILFTGAGHELRACAASSQMQWLIERAGPTRSSVGEVRLRMSTGVFSGTCHFFLVGSTHRELVVAGPAATETVRLESAAEAGEIVVSTRTAEALEPPWLGGEREGARLLQLPDDLEPPPPPPSEEAHGPPDLALYVPAPLRAHLEVEAGEGEHRQAAVAFLKFAGTDDLLAAEGAEAVHARLDELGQVVGDHARDLSITWLESDIDANGGKLYLTAGAPTSAGEDEERMLRAVRRILDEYEALGLRAGVNRGPVFAGDVGASTRRTYAVMGDTVNLAARLVARAGAGELYATADALDRSRTQFETTHQPYLMKGKELPVTAYSVGAITGVREEREADELPLVGRDAELAALTDAVDAARMRQARMIELVGEPGIGKSRLVRELRGLAAGFQQLSVRCERYQSAQPFFAFRGLLRPLAGITPDQGAEEAGARLAPWVQAVMPDLAPWLPLLAIPFDAAVPQTPETEGLDAAFRRDRLHEVVEQFLTRVMLMPTLLVFEDVHWIDDASHFLLGHLAASPMPRPWLVCATRRPEGEPAWPEGIGTILRLSPLAEDAAARLALTAAGEHPLAEQDLATLTERAAGNPLFVRELVAASRTDGSVEELPETVETLLTTRIDRLDPENRLLLRYASVVGPTFELELLREILDEDPGVVDDLERWSRLTEFVEWGDGGTLHFRHELFRAVAYAGLSFRRRRQIHLRVGEALERRAGADAREAAGLLSLHFAEAGEHSRAWRYAVEAGRRAQAVHANVVAAELYGRALGAAEGLPDLPRSEVAAVWESLGDVTELFGRYDRALDAYAHARTLVGEEPEAHARLLRKTGLVQERRGRNDEALSLYDQGLQLLEAHEESAPEGLAELELAYAGVRFRQGRYDQAVRWADRAAAHAQAVDARRSIAHARYLRGTAAALGLGNRDVQDLLQALEVYEELGDHVGQGNVLNNLGIVDYYAGRWDGALSHWRRSREAKHRAGDVVNEAIQANNEGEILSDQGKLDEAVALFEEALRVHRAAGYAVGVAVDLGNLGRAAARKGDFAEAQERLAEALAAFAEMGAGAFALETRARQAEAHMLAGEHRAAYDGTTALLGDEGAEAPVLRTLVERIAGYAALQNRDPALAREHLERSLEQARAADAPYETALTMLALAELGRRDGLGRPDEHEPEARELLDGLGVVSTPRIPLP